MHSSMVTRLHLDKTLFSSPKNLPSSWPLYARTVVVLLYLEILEALKGTSLDALSLLTQKGSDQSMRIKSVDEVVFAELGTIPWNPRLRAAFGALNDSTLEWLRTGRFDVKAVDRALHPRFA